ncbi:MAG: energy transducer TonB, partial [Bacteroidota bacterium]
TQMLAFFFFYICSTLIAATAGPTPPELIQRASFLGGEEAQRAYFENAIQYPTTARESGLEGTVTVAFHVLTDGSIYAPKIVSSLHKCCDEEVLRVIQEMPKWVPARKDGKVMASLVKLTIQFRLLS